MPKKSSVSSCYVFSTNTTEVGSASIMVSAEADSTAWVTLWIPTGKAPSVFLPKSQLSCFVFFFSFSFLKQRTQRKSFPLLSLRHHRATIRWLIEKRITDSLKQNHLPAPLLMCGCFESYTHHFKENDLMWSLNCQSFCAVRLLEFVF